MKTRSTFKTIALSLLLSSATLLTNAQTPSIEWQKTKGGVGDDYTNPNSMIKLSDGNFLVYGTTTSPFPGVHGDYDAFIYKLNPNGKTIWKKVYGGTGNDDFWGVIQTDNGSFIAVGSTNSNDGDVIGNHGGDNDGWVVKLSANGNFQWQKCYGGSGDDKLTSVTKGSGNNFIVAGLSNSNDGDVNSNHGDYDGWVVKSNNSGNILWSKCIGGSAYDEIYGISKVAGNYYVATGSTASNDGDISGNHGGDYDAYAVRLNDNGNLSWSKCYGGSNFEFPNTSTILADGNICFTGVTLSNDGDVVGYHGGHNESWTVKLNQHTGSIIWQICVGNADPNTGEAGFGITPTADGGVLVGDEFGFEDQATSINAKATKIDKNGNQEWAFILGGSDNDWATGAIQTNDGDYILSCYTMSNDGDVTNQHGEGDVWLVKLSADGCHQHHRDAAPDENSFALRNSPNPISTETSISFTLPQAENCLITIYDVTGKAIATLCENKLLEVGTHTIKWNVEGIDAGIYFLKFNAGDYAETKKMLIVK